MVGPTPASQANSQTSGFKFNDKTCNSKRCKHSEIYILKLEHSIVFLYFHVVLEPLLAYLEAEPVNGETERFFYWNQ